MNVFYTTAFQNKEYTELKDISMQPESMEEINSCYTDLVNQIQSGRKLSLEIGDIQPETSYYLGDDGQFYIEVYLNYNYSGLYEDVDWYDSKSIESYSGQQETVFTYCLNNSDIQLSSISGLRLYAV